MSLDFRGTVKYHFKKGHEEREEAEESAAAATSPSTEPTSVGANLKVLQLFATRF